MTAILTIAGWVPSAPTQGTTKAGETKHTFSVCVFGTRKDPMWVKVVLMGDRLCKLAPHIKPGARVVVVGALAKPTPYEGNDGQMKTSLMIFGESISFIPYEKETGEAMAKGSRADQLKHLKGQAETHSKKDPLDDDRLPF